MFQWLAGGVGDPRLIALHAAADGILALSFFAIPICILWVLPRRFDLFAQHRTLAVLFCAFILTSGMLHVTELVEEWFPIYGLQGLFKAITAAIAIATVAFMWPLLPGLASFSSDLKQMNDRLRREVRAHESTLRELEVAGAELENRVAQRTLELGHITARFETALRGAKVTVFTQDENLHYTSVSSPMFGRSEEEILGRADADILPAEALPGIASVKRDVLQTGQPRDAELRVEDAGYVHWYDFHIEPLRDASGAIVGLICAAVETTAAKESAEHLRLLLREITHRSKNLLAIIQAMARQTARGAGSVETFLEQFSARVQALARSHDLLVQESWHGASLPDLVRSQLAIYLDGASARVSVAGPAALLKPEAAHSLGLALHELAANAAKYGALSVPMGQVALNWRRLSPPEGDGIEMIWIESGGPEVLPPPQRGFGSLVIERNLARSIDCAVDLSFPPDGVRCRVLIPRRSFRRLKRGGTLWFATAFLGREGRIGAERKRRH